MWHRYRVSLLNTTINKVSRVPGIKVKNFKSVQFVINPPREDVYDEIESDSGIGERMWKKGEKREKFDGKSHSRCVKDVRGRLSSVMVKTPPDEEEWKREKKIDRDPQTETSSVGKIARRCIAGSNLFEDDFGREVRVHGYSIIADKFCMAFQSVSSYN